MKIKILVECDPQSLEKLVNEFIADKQVIDIKFEIDDYPDYFLKSFFEYNTYTGKLIKITTIANRLRMPRASTGMCSRSSREHSSGYSSPE